MRSGIEKKSGDGKTRMSKRLAQMKLQNEIVLKQCRLIDEKNDKLMENSPFNQRKVFEVNGVGHKQHPVYDLYAVSKCGKIININEGDR